MGERGGAGGSPGRRGQETLPRSGIRKDDGEEGRRAAPLPFVDGAQVDSAAGSSGSKAGSPGTPSTGMKPEAELACSFICSQKMWHRSNETRSRIGMGGPRRGPRARSSQGAPGSPEAVSRVRRL